MYIKAFLVCLLALVSSCVAVSSICPSNCTGNPCVDGRCVCLYPSNTIDCSTKWLDGPAGTLMLVYVVVSSIVFLGTVVVSGVQLIKWVYYTGLRPNVPKLLHLIIFLQGIIRTAWLLTGGLDILRGHAGQTLAEGMLDGLGIAALVVCYMLTILLWLQVYAQTTVASGPPHCCVRRRTIVVSVCVVLYVVSELCVRLVWNISDDPVDEAAAMAAYHSLVLAATIACTVAFAVLSVMLQRVMRGTLTSSTSTTSTSTSTTTTSSSTSTSSTSTTTTSSTSSSNANATWEGGLRNRRARQMAQFTVFTLAVSAATVLLQGIAFAVEASLLRWRSWDSWLVEQVVTRALEAIYACGTLWYLRRVPPHEVMPHRRTHPSHGHHQHQPYQPYHRSLGEEDSEDDPLIKRVNVDAAPSPVHDI